MRASVLLAGVSMSLLSGCSVTVGARSDSKGIDVSGLAGGYASLNGVRPYDGTIMEIAVCEHSRRSKEFEVASLEVWPLLGLGVGLAGARVQLLFLDVGLGVLAYDPEAPQWPEKSAESAQNGEEGQGEGEANAHDEVEPEAEAQPGTNAGTTAEP